MKLDKGLLKGSLVLLIFFGIFNVLNFMVQLFMARMLNTEDFAIFATLSAMVYMLAIFVESIQATLSRYSANEDDPGKLKNLLIRSLSKSFKYSFMLFAVYLIISIPAMYLLKIDYSLLALNGLIIFSAFLLPVTRGVMQGRKKFFPLGTSMAIESITRLTFSIILVYIGLRVYGAVLGVFIGMTFALILSLVSLRRLFKSPEKKSITLDIKKYARSAFFVSAVVIFFYTIDIVIAKIVFSATAAGYYSYASIAAKAIFWGTLPISKAMFPMTSENKRREKDLDNVFHNSFFIVLGLIIFALVIFLFFPEWVIFILKGQAIRESISILFFLGLAMGLISLSNLNLLYKLSRIREIKNSDKILLGGVSLVETALLFYFSSNLITFSLALVVSASMLFFVSFYVLNE